MSELEILKNEIEGLRVEVKEGFERIEKKLENLRAKVEERRVANGVQDALLGEYGKDLEKLEKKIHILEKEQQGILIEVERRDKKYVKWLIGLTLSILGTVVTLIQFVVR